LTQTKHLNFKFILGAFPHEAHQMNSLTQKSTKNPFFNNPKMTFNLKKLPLG